MSIQVRPICFECKEPVENSMVFCAPCDHEDCPSTVFHGLCLMEWREKRGHMIDGMRESIEVTFSQLQDFFKNIQGPSTDDLDEL